MRTLGRTGRRGVLCDVRVRGGGGVFLSSSSIHSVRSMSGGGVTTRQVRVAKHKEGGHEADLLYQEGLLHLDNDHLQKAISTFDRVLLLDPADARVYAARALCLQRMGDLQKAESDYRRVVSLSPDSPPARVALANCLHQQSRQKKKNPALALEALGILQQLVSAVGPHVEACILAAEILLEQGRVEEALRWTEGISLRGRGGPLASAVRGEVLARVGEFHEAEKILRNALEEENVEWEEEQEEEETNVAGKKKKKKESGGGNGVSRGSRGRLWGALGSVHYAMEQPGEAVEDFTKAFLATGEKKHKLQRAAAYLMMGHAKEALDDLESYSLSSGTSKKKTPEDDDVYNDNDDGGEEHVFYLLKGSAHFSLEHWKEAWESWDTWIKQQQEQEEGKKNGFDDHQLREVCKMSAQCLQQMGREEEADVLLKRATPPLENKVAKKN